MHDELFDDPELRHAFESSLGFRARPLQGAVAAPGWFFERSRLGFRHVELAPLGFYGPVCGDDRQASNLRAFLDTARGALVASVVVNINPLEPRADEIAQHAATAGYRIITRQTHLLPIDPSIESMRRDFHATKRYEALREVVAESAIFVASEPTQLEDYFDVYATSLARWGRGEFIYPRSLFTALLRCGSVKIWMNRVAGRLACAMVVFYCRRYAFYWQGVSRIEEDQKRAYPVVKLMDAVLQHLAQSGIPCLNLGASEGLPKVRAFKESFGAQPTSYPVLIYESRLWRGLMGARSRWRGAFS